MRGQAAQLEFTTHNVRAPRSVFRFPDGEAQTCSGQKPHGADAVVQGISQAAPLSEGFAMGSNDLVLPSQKEAYEGHRPYGIEVSAQTG